MYESEPLAEYSLHYDIMQKIHVGIVEIGVLNGETSNYFLENCKLPIFGIDPLIPDSMNDELVGNINSINMLKRKYSNYTFIKDYSYNAVLSFNYKFDYLFIDADHTYEAVKKDFHDWFPLLNRGGYVSFHDSAKYRGGPHHWEGPSRLVDELIADLKNNGLEYYRTIYSLTSFKKA